MSRERGPDAGRPGTEFAFVTQAFAAERAAVRAGSRLEQRAAAQRAWETNQTASEVGKGCHGSSEHVAEATPLPSVGCRCNAKIQI